MKTIIIYLTVILMTSITKIHSDNQSKIITDFSSPAQQNNWRIINDGVMGGISRSSFRINSDSTATFSGVVSLENNGGFASVRSNPSDYELGEYNGLRLRVRGDGNIYNLRLRTSSNFDGISYRVVFRTQKNQWMEVAFSFSDFVPTYRGRDLSNVEPLKAAKIRQIGILISDKQEGAFTLDIDWIKAYK